MENPQIHIRFEGRSFDIGQNEVDVGMLSSDDEIRQVLSDRLNIPLMKLQVYDIHRNQQTGSMTVSPRALLGQK